MNTAERMEPQRSEDDALTRAIAAEFEAQDAQAELKQASRTAEQARKGRDKARREADEQRARADRLSEKLEAANKEAKRVRHELTQELRKVKAEKAKGEAVPDYPTITSKDGQCIVQLALGQVHVHEKVEVTPGHWWHRYMISSMPLHLAEKNRLIMCGLVDGVKQGDYGDFAMQAAHRLARRWRKDNGCLRVEDLDIPAHIAVKIEDAGYEMASDISHKNAPEVLSKIKGIGPSALKKVAKALRKEGLA